MSEPNPDSGESLDDLLATLARNVPWSGRQDENSFLGRLAEEGVWDDAEHGRLEDTIVALIRPGETGEPASEVFEVYARFCLLVRAHYDPHDIFRIADVDEIDLRDRIDRFEYVVRCFFHGEPP